MIRSPRFFTYPLLAILAIVLLSVHAKAKPGDSPGAAVKSTAASATTAPATPSQAVTPNAGATVVKSAYVSTLIYADCNPQGIRTVHRASGGGPQLCVAVPVDPAVQSQMTRRNTMMVQLPGAAGFAKIS